MFTTMQYTNFLRTWSIGFLLAAALLLAACTGIQPVAAPATAPEEPAATIPEVTIEVNDEGFVIPDDFPGGIVAVTVQNNSSKDMDVSFARVNEGASVEEIKALFADQMANLVPLLQHVSALPSFNPVASGQAQSVIIDFRTGQFLAIANEHVEDAPPPGLEYLWGEFTADELVGTVEPQTDVTIAFNDFNFDMPDTIPAGDQLWEYDNTGEQWHMVFFVKLAPDATMEDVMNFIMSDGEPAGPPPFEELPNTGLAPISQGERAWLDVSFEPGTYVAVCPLPDMAAMMNGEEPIPHMMQGMIRQFTVEP